MGLDLTLLPFDFPLPNTVSMSSTVLDCERRRELFEAIHASVHGEGAEHCLVPEDFRSYVGRHKGCEEPGYGLTVDDPYGVSVKFVHASHLLAFAKHPDVLDNRRNRAVWAYLAELLPDTRVALYWH